jgi:hypothetical protein
LREESAKKSGAKWRRLYCENHYKLYNFIPFIHKSLFVCKKMLCLRKKNKIPSSSHLHSPKDPNYLIGVDVKKSGAKWMRGEGWDILRY